MGQAIGQILPAAVGAAVSPLADRGRRAHARHAARSNAPVVIYFALGDRSQLVLDRLRTWMVRNNPAIMSMLLLILGVKDIGDAITGFST